MRCAAVAGLISATLAVASAQQPTDSPGPYDVKLTWTAGSFTFLDAVREQLGLQLEPTDAPVQVLVIDGFKRPKGQ